MHFLGQRGVRASEVPRERAERRLGTGRGHGVVMVTTKRSRSSGDPLPVPDPHRRCAQENLHAPPCLLQTQVTRHVRQRRRRAAAPGRMVTREPTAPASASGRSCRRPRRAARAPADHQPEPVASAAAAANHRRVGDAVRFELRAGRGRQRRARRGHAGAVAAAPARLEHHCRSPRPAARRGRAVRPPAPRSATSIATTRAPGRAATRPRFPAHRAPRWRLEHRGRVPPPPSTAVERRRRRRRPCANDGIMGLDHAAR